MGVILNKWIEKVKKKKEHETAPSYDSISDSEIKNVGEKRHTIASRGMYKHTLRGVRK